MNVGQLIEALATIDPQTKVMVSSDAEGNEFSGLDEVTQEAADAAWDGERTDGVINPDEIDPDDEHDLQDVVVLWRV